MSGPIQTTTTETPYRNTRSKVWRVVFYGLVAGYGLVLWPLAILCAGDGLRLPGETDYAFRTSSFTYYLFSAPLYLGALVLLAMVVSMPDKRRWPWILVILVAVASVALRRWYMVMTYPPWIISG